MALCVVLSLCSAGTCSGYSACSDGECEVIEGDAEPVAARSLGSDVVVAAAQVLGESMSYGEDPRPGAAAGAGEPGLGMIANAPSAVCYWLRWSLITPSAVGTGQARQTRPAP